MRLPTITLRHKKKGNKVKVNASDWAQDLGRFKYRDYERIGESRGDAEAESNPETSSGVSLVTGGEGVDVAPDHSQTVIDVAEDEGEGEEAAQTAIGVDAVIESEENKNDSLAPRRSPGRPPKGIK